MIDRNKERNDLIVSEYRKGISVSKLAEKYYMTESGIRTILRVRMDREEYFKLRGKRKKKGYWLKM